MRKPQRVPTRPDGDENDPPVSPEELAVIRKRDKTYEQERKAARPANEVTRTATPPSSRSLSRPVRITPFAEADIAQAQDDYESREPGLGNRFVEQVRSTLTRIGQNPFQYQVVKGTREHRRAPGASVPVWHLVSRRAGRIGRRRLPGASAGSVAGAAPDDAVGGTVVNAKLDACTIPSQSAYGERNEGVLLAVYSIRMLLVLPLTRKVIQR